MSLTPDKMQEIGKGYLVTHKRWIGVWVVIEREYDVIRCITVNTQYPVQVTFYVDDNLLSLVEV